MYLPEFVANKAQYSRGLHLECFYRCWTLRETYLKAIGVGLAPFIIYGASVEKMLTPVGGSDHSARRRTHAPSQRFWGGSWRLQSRIIIQPDQLCERTAQ